MHVVRLSFFPMQSAPAAKYVAKVRDTARQLSLIGWSSHLFYFPELQVSSLDPSNNKGKNYGRRAKGLGSTVRYGQWLTLG